jgi:kynurenine--oxoglutarate transaminase/cysteine-S-conjugate beta-lyase/glutamine--phenylpyruvate transaminase
VVKDNDIIVSECELSTEGTIDCDKNSDVKAYTIPSVWTTFGELAVSTSSSNLGQGFPDWPPPQFVRDALRETVDSSFHQYTRPAGHPPLVKLLAERYSMHLNRPIDAFSEVAVTVGASQALYLALRIFLNDADDEVVVFEPFFDVKYPILCT